MKTSRLNLRIPDDLNEEVKRAAEAGEYRYVSTYIEEAIREKIERDQEGQHPQIPPTLTGASEAVSEPSPPVQVTTFRHLGGDAIQPAAPRGECPRKANHRVGTYCKGCNKVITKGTA